MDERIACRRALRPQFREYRAHDRPPDGETVRRLKWQLLGLVGLCILMLSSFGYTYAYFSSEAVCSGNSFRMAQFSDFVELCPGSAVVWEPDPRAEKEQVAFYGEDGRLVLNFGIIGDRGNKIFHDVLRVRNRSANRLSLNIAAVGPAGDIIVAGPGQVDLPPADAAGGQGGQEPWLSLDFTLRGIDSLGAYTGKLLLSGMNGYLSTEIPVVITVADQLAKNDNRQGDPEPGRAAPVNGEPGTGETDPAPGMTAPETDPPPVRQSPDDGGQPAQSGEAAAPSPAGQAGTGQEPGPASTGGTHGPDDAPPPSDPPEPPQTQVGPETNVGPQTNVGPETPVLPPTAGSAAPGLPSGALIGISADIA